MEDNRSKVTVIGRGNVGSQMSRIFNTVPIDPHTLEGLPEDSALYVIAVSDDAVESVAAKIPKVKGIVVHTTGSVPMDVLLNVKCTGYGVFYPFQTVSKSRVLSAEDIPLLVEASDDATLMQIKKIAEMYGFGNVTEADSEMRRRTHLAGTFVCNFPNALLGIGQRIFLECGINPKIGNPLIAETVEKLRHLAAADAQTGPAARKDYATLDKHRSLLEELGMESERRIYDIISEYIMNQKK